MMIRAARIGFVAAIVFGVLAGVAVMVFSPGLAPSTAAAQGNAGPVTDGLQARQAALLNRLPLAGAEELPALLAELAAVRQALADPDAAATARRDLTAQMTTLSDLSQGSALAPAIASAQGALAAGDLAAAETALVEARRGAEAEVARAARLSRAQADLAAARGALVEAGRLYVRAAALDPSPATLLAALRGARAAGDMQTAVSYAQPVINAAVQSAGQGTAAHGEALAEVAQTLIEAGRAAEAEPLLREAVAIGKGPNGTRDAALAQRLNNLAIILFSAGRTAEAEPLLREAVEIDNSVLGERNPVVAARLQNLAALLAAKGQADEAEALYRRAAEITEVTLGEDHPQTVQQIEALAGFLIAQGKTEPAADALERALAATERAFPPGHPDHASRISALADRLGTVRPARAEAAYQRLVQALAATPVPQPADLARAQNNLGQLLVAQGRAAEAVPLLRDAAATLAEVLGPDSAEARTVRANLAAAGG